MWPRLGHRMALLAPAHLALHCDAGWRFGCLGGQGNPDPNELVCGGPTRWHHQSNSNAWLHANGKLWMIQCKTFTVSMFGADKWPPRKNHDYSKRRRRNVHCSEYNTQQKDCVLSRLKIKNISSKMTVRSDEYQGTMVESVRTSQVLPVDTNFEGHNSALPH